MVCVPSANIFSRNRNNKCYQDATVSMDKCCPVKYAIDDDDKINAIKMSPSRKIYKDTFDHKGDNGFIYFFVLVRYFQ